MTATWRQDGARLTLQADAGARLGTVEHYEQGQRLAGPVWGWTVRARFGRETGETRGQAEAVALVEQAARARGFRVGP